MQKKGSQQQEYNRGDVLKDHAVDILVTFQGSWAETLKLTRLGDQRAEGRKGKYEGAIQHSLLHIIYGKGGLTAGTGKTFICPHQETSP
jgi:hypothetical protein